MSLPGIVDTIINQEEQSQDQKRSSGVLEPPNKHDLGNGTRPSTPQSSSNNRNSWHVKGNSTPSMRTGPPRSLSYNYSPSHSPLASRKNSRHEGDPPDSGPSEFPFNLTGSTFRGVLEGLPGIIGAQQDKKGKKRESRVADDSWNPIKWFHDSPTDEKEGFDLEQKHEPNGDAAAGSRAASIKSPQRSPSGGPTSAEKRPGAAKWNRLKSLLPNVTGEKTAVGSSGQGNVAVQHTVNITDELITGGLSTLMLRLWFERDEKDHRRVPVLFHRLRIRISDSLHPTKGNKAVFRIECEYANGAARWVVYRQLRDFLSLHGHYIAAKTYARTSDDLPEFPKTSLPYFKFLNRDRQEKVTHADFARQQRQALENYLIDLIRAVMFHPSTNRLAGFLEISALSIALAQSGGAQYKAGYLQFETTGKSTSFGRRSASWSDKRQARWSAVRESYLVVLVEPGELEVWDVFLLDSDFAIERPRRYYRQGLRLLQHEHDGASVAASSHRKSNSEVPKNQSENGDISRRASIRHTFHKILHPRHKAATDAFPYDEDDHASVSSSSTSSSSSRPPTPLLDPSTNMNTVAPAENDDEKDGQDDVDRPWHPDRKKNRTGQVSQHTFYLINSQMRLKVTAKNKRQMEQYITALEKVAATSHYTGSNRFDSFAPIRMNVAAQWLVDGRDYFWNLSRAILLAKESVYIHDWWLSPELQMRRPNKDRYRLDRLLERKAKEGVKIYVIVYQEVSNRTTPTDSAYTKQRLTSLHPNIMVQRSPSHFQTGTFYWAHHEKLCVIDQAIAFMGGLDLCFGRWDTPQHVVADEPDENGETSVIWPGKDYSNPRVLDFYNLNKPGEDMYDRSKVPRMPWHDVGLQIVGQPARDLCRHFVQRWNYLLRIKNHSRVMPFLLPPPEFRPGELTQMGLTGTCEMQICRSAGPWSLGTPQRIEHSIQNAYLKAIQMSEHFVYIENQFFITSTVVNDVKVENKIGDAIVHRIIRAHRDKTTWKCCIMIPLIPGFTYPIDHNDASAIRLILECQNRTISRGPHSIFARLRKEGIDPDDYITVFSLRNWAKLGNDTLTTEQVYIHGKVCIVDDRLAIIGSANINERSQRGDRDSEIAAIIRDTDMIDGTMAGKPYKVGRFAHTLRVRLMREHLGVDVDTMDEDDLMANEPVQAAHEQVAWDPENEQQRGQEGGITKETKHHQRAPGVNLGSTIGNGLEHIVRGTEEAISHSVRKVLPTKGKGEDVIAIAEEGIGGDSLMDDRTTFTRDGKQVPGFAGSVVPTAEEKMVMEHLPHATKADDAPLEDKLDGTSDPKATSSSSSAEQEPAVIHSGKEEKYGAPADASRSAATDDQPPHARRTSTPPPDEYTQEEQSAPEARSNLRRHLGSKLGNKTWTVPVPRPNVDPEGFEDPVCDAFWKEVWVASAAHNTEIYRKVFHAIPDDLVTTWKQYKEFVVHHERLNKPVKDSPSMEPVARMPSETGDEGAPAKEGENYGPSNSNEESGNGSSSKEGGEQQQQTATSSPAPPPDGLERDGTTKGKAKATTGTEGFERWERDEMERLLGELNGHLVIFPNRFLEGEDVANNFLFNADRLLPLPIYD